MTPEEAAARLKCAEELIDDAATYLHFGNVERAFTTYRAAWIIAIKVSDEIREGLPFPYEWRIWAEAALR